MRGDRRWLLSACVLLSWSALAQLRDTDPDWKESSIPPPPEFQAERMLPLDMPRHITTRIGIDPETLRITEDGIVRYVMVAPTPGGSVNASYEGIRCLTGEVKVYARYASSGTWRALPDATWKPLNGNQPSLHALALARQGACDGRAATAGSVENIITRLKSPPRDQVQR